MKTDAVTNSNPAAWRGRRLGVVGAGKMAEALIRAALNAKLLPAASVTAADPVAERRSVFADLGCATTPDASTMTGHDTVLLSIKPQQAEALLKKLGPAWGPNTLVISVMAGVPTSWIARPAGTGTRIVRAMPNLPLMAGAGATAVTRGSGATPADEDLALALFAAGGRAWAVPEKWLDAVTAVSGSGPAYFYRMTEAMAEGGRALGLPAELAEALARETLWGAAKLLHDSGEGAGTLREGVTSPGGTTAAALSVFDAPPPGVRDLSSLIREAIAAAARRAHELQPKC